LSKQTHTMFKINLQGPTVLIIFITIMLPLFSIGQRPTHSRNLSSSKGDIPHHQPPNIIFIMSDDHAYQAISAYGYGLNKTPNIDRIAAEGALFTRAFVTNSIC